ncbi:MAG TPA: DUF2927 domain-containing protein [Candidatus Angelobacter sp.]|nr:DUF2927 domain-containing protein [Candidatus Angelobacter sp.]
MLLARTLSWAAGRFALGLAVAGALLTSERASRADDPLSNAEVVTNLMEIVFGSEFVGEDSDIVRKWTAPVRIAIYAKEPERYRALVEPVLQQLHGLTGLDIRLVDRSEANQNAYILILGREQFYAYAESHLSPGKNPRTNTYLDCFGVFAADRGGVINELTAVIPDLANDATRRSCVIEEVTQALGLPNDSFTVKPSIFNDDDEYQDLTWQDQLFLRVLYDERVRPGMTRTAFEPLARRIVDELRPGH